MEIKLINDVLSEDDVLFTDNEGINDMFEFVKTQKKFYKDNKLNNKDTTNKDENNKDINIKKARG